MVFLKKANMPVCPSNRFYTASWTHRSPGYLGDFFMYDKTMLQLKCCGADGPDDWATSVGWEDHEATPDSCCVEKGAGCGKEKDKASKKVYWEILFQLHSHLNSFLWTSKYFIYILCVLFRVALRPSTYFWGKDWWRWELSVYFLQFQR